MSSGEGTKRVGIEDTSSRFAPHTPLVKGIDLPGAARVWSTECACPLSSSEVHELKEPQQKLNFQSLKRGTSQLSLEKRKRKAQLACSLSLSEGALVLSQHDQDGEGGKRIILELQLPPLASRAWACVARTGERWRHRRLLGVPRDEDEC